MVRVGLVGFGFAGRVFHAQVISAVEGLELAVIVQRTGDSAAAAYPRGAGGADGGGDAGGCFDSGGGGGYSECYAFFDCAAVFAGRAGCGGG